MRILIVDNTIEEDCWGSSELQHYARQISGATVHVRRAPEGDLPADPLAFDRIIISGSGTEATKSAPWISALLDFMRRAIEGKRQMLGICFGHQMLARIQGGVEAVGRAKLGEIGWTEIEQLGQSPLFEGLPKRFHTFSSHFDEVSSVPPGMRNLARSPACAVQAMQLGDLPIYGIQFHPERDVAGAEKSFVWARTVRMRKERFDLKVLLNEKARGKLYDMKIGERIFGNFLCKR